MSTINSTSGSQTANPSASLNQADFLKLLVTQMTSQDPLNPTSDTEFAAQLAQFSSLQESTTMATDMQTLQANALIGETVNLTSSTNSQQTSTGVVTGVQMSAGVPEIVVGGQLFNLNQINSITPTPATTGNTTSNSTSGTTGSN